MAQQHQSTTVIPRLPSGYTIGISPDGQRCVVPQFMVPGLDAAFASYREKALLDVVKARSGSLHMKTRPQDVLAEGRIHIPPNPDLSDQERLGLHAEILALQTRLGISYKDAAHRLYIAELEMLKVQDIASKAFENLESRIDSYLKSLNVKFMEDGNVPVDK